jgi:threonine dehydrogenase-like Zn-dependent dehydrogenase
VEGRIQALPMITHRFPLSEIAAAFAAADDKGTSDSIKVVVEP